MVGREDALRKLRGYSEEAVSGRGVLVLISGEAGIGKTRLAEEFEKEAVGRSFTVMVGRCVPGTPTPYFPFLDAFKRVTDEGSTDSKSGSRLITTIRKAAPDIVAATPMIGPYLRASASIYKEYSLSVDYKSITDPKTESERTLFSMLDLLKRISAKQPLLLRIEDLQWADSASIQMVHFFARNSTGLRVLMVGTYRTEEMVNAITGGIHPLLENIRIMRREGICKEIALTSLKPEEIKGAIEGMLGMPADSTITQRIASESGGNPLFAGEILRYLSDANSIVPKDGIWVLKDGGELDIPPTVKEVILRRIERLSRDEKRVLECASAIGTYFGAGVVSDVLRLERLETLEVLDRLDRSHQLVVPSDDDFRFDHELLRRVTYEQISVPRRKELHRVIGNTLESMLPNDSVLGELSFHFYNSNVTDKCMKYSLMAGEACLRRLAMIEAVPYFERALETAKADSSKQKERLQALEGLGDAYRGLYNAATAINFYNACLSEAEGQQSSARILRKSALCWAPYGLGKGNSSKARELLAEAERCSDIEPIERAEIISFHGELNYLEGRFEESSHLSFEAEKLFEEANASSKLATEYTNHAACYLSQGLVDNASTMLEKAKIINSMNPSVSADIDITFTQGMKHFHRGDLEEGLACFDRTSEMATKVGEYGFLFTCHLLRVLIFDIRSNFNGMFDEALKALELSKRVESGYNRITACTLMIHALKRSGREDKIESECLKTISNSKTDEWDVHTFSRGFIEIVRGEIFADQGDWPRSNRMFEYGIELLSRGNYGVLYGAIARGWYAEYLGKQGSKAKAIEQYLKAAELYKRMGNSSQENWIMEKVASISMR
jgi:tetratricopeptide (TPR) repeat protein